MATAFLKTVFSYCVLPLEIYSEVSIQEYTENHELRNIAVNRNQSGVSLSSFDAINVLRSHQASQQANSGRVRDQPWLPVPEISLI